MRRIGVLMGLAEGDPEGQKPMQAFRERLADLGWLEGRTLRIDQRWTGLNVPREQNDARDLVALAPEVILSTTTTTTRALRDATQWIPI
jgi:putative ABC transport system substrate-binding protein